MATNAYSTAMGSGCEVFTYRYQASMSIAKHHHETTLLMMMVHGQYDEKDDLGRTHEIGRGHLLYMPQGCEHAHSACDSGAALIGLSLSNGFMLELDWRGLSEPIRIDRLQGVNSALRLLRTCNHVDRSTPIDLESSVLETLAEITSTPLGAEEKWKPKWVDDAKELLHVHHNEDVSLSELAATLGVDRCHLARTFRRYTNDSLGSYLRSVRLQSACRMMLDREMTLGEIAVSAGFYDHSHFTREFKKAFHTEPSQYLQAAGRLAAS